MRSGINRTVKGLAYETEEDLRPEIVTCEKPVIFVSEAEAARVQECEYCGHSPCGCGG